MEKRFKKGIPDLKDIRPRIYRAPLLTKIRLLAWYYRSGATDKDDMLIATAIYNNIVDVLEGEENEEEVRTEVE